MARKGERGNPDTLITLVPHPHLLSRAEWLASGISRAVRADLVTLRPLRARPLLALLPHNVTASLSILSRRKRYAVALSFNLMIFPALYLLRRIGLVGLLVYDDADYLPAFSEGVWKSLTSLLEDLAVSKSDAVISASKTLARMRKRRNERVYILENGVSKRLCSCPEVSSTDCSFVYAGNVDFRYAHLDVVVRAVRGSEVLSNVNFYIVGTGKDLENLINMTSDVNNIYFISTRSPRELASFLRRATFGLAPYRLGGSALYGSPLKVKEYLASGLCPIVSNLKPIVEFIDEVGGCYFLINDPMDESEVRNVLENAYRDCLDKREDIRRKAELASARVCDRYSWVALSLKYAEILSELRMKVIGGLKDA